MVAAIAECNAALVEDPGDVQAWMLLGGACHRQDQLHDALAAFEKVLELRGPSVQTLSARAAVLVDMGRLVEAESTLADAVSAWPNEAVLLTNLANVLELAGKTAEALQQYMRALSLQPDLYPALLNASVLLLRQGHAKDALEINRRLVHFHPQSFDARLNLVETLLAEFLYGEAVAVCDRLIAEKPESAKALLFRAIGNAGLSRWWETERDFTSAIRHDQAARAVLRAGLLIASGVLGNFFDARSLYVQMLYRSVQACDWTRLEELVRSLEEFVKMAWRTEREVADPALPLISYYLPVSADTRLALAQGVAEKLEQSAAGFKCATRARSRSGSGGVRVAYVSPDFGRHPTGYLTRRLYGLHDRKHFEVFGYALRPEDGSSVGRDIRDGCDTFRDLSGKSSAEIVERARLDGIDIAVDLAGYTRFARPDAFASRIAPLQVSYLGFPATLGAHYVDYAIVDRIACPASDEANWTERLVRMPDTFFIADNAAEIDPVPGDRKAHGLPPEGFVFCCFNGSHKIDPLTFDVWMRLLRRVQGSVMWLIGQGEITQRNLCREATERGVDPRRLIFAPFLSKHATHLGRYCLADLFLDTRYYNAHTTAVEALWSGLPVLTVPGTETPSRVGASLVTALGLPELVCRDFPDYEDRALFLARHPQRLAALKNKLAANRNSCPLFDTEARVRQLEAAFGEMWRRHLAGLPPASFEVKRQPEPEIRNRWH